MKILLINPRSSRRSGLNLHSGGYFQPLSLATIAGATTPDVEVIVEDENWRPASLRTDVDLVGLTAFTSSVPRAYELAAAYRAAGIPTVLGGVHALACQQEAAERFDAVVLREADQAWGEVIRDAQHGRLQKFYQGGLAQKFALPRRNVLDAGYMYSSVQIARGCPMGCDFCSVPWFSGHTMRRQALERTLEDLFSIQSRGVFFVDDNLIGYSQQDRAAVLSMLLEMKAAGFKKPWMAQCSINVTADREFLEAMRAAGCRMVMIGIEAADAAGLASVRKKLNQRYDYDFRAVHEAGMSVMGFFILGLETDTRDVMLDRIKTIHACGVDAWQITVLTPLPGTRLFERMQSSGRLLHSNFPDDWGYYDFVDSTFVPDGFRGVGEFRDCLAECIRLAYSDEALREASIRTRDATSLEAAVMAVAGNLKYQKVALARLQEEGR